MAVGPIGLIPCIEVQVGHKSLERPEPFLAQVASGVDTRPPISIKDIGSKRFITVLIPERSEKTVVALALGAELVA